MNRRLFLQTALASTGTAQAPPQSPAPPKKAKITSSVMLWTLKGTFEEKVQNAAKAGMQSVEFVDEHVNWTSVELNRKKRFVGSFGMGIDTIIATPNWARRPVSMVDPAHREAFLADVKNAITFAQELDGARVILMSGNAIPGRTYEEQFASLVEGAKRAAELAAAAKVQLIIEPLNAKVNHQGNFLTTCTEGLRVVKEVDSPHLRLLFDLYHEQVQVGDPLKLAVEAAPYVSVYHVADSPGRNDPGTGEMKYSDIYKAIAKAGYSGYIAMEYLPLADPVVSLTKAIDQMRANV